MATTTPTRQNVLTYSAYALLGAGDLVLDQARRLSERRDELPDQVVAQLNDAVEELRAAVDRALDELGSQARARRDEAGSSLDELAERGRALLTRLSREPDVTRAKGDVVQATRGVKGAITTLRTSADTVVSRVKAVSTLTGRAADSVEDAAGTVAKEVTGRRHDRPLSEHTKAQLYELATARDIEGRSQMTKDELVRALS